MPTNSITGLRLVTAADITTGTTTNVTTTATMRAAWKPNNLPERFVYTGRKFTRYGFNLPEHPLNNPYTLEEYGEAAVPLYVDHLLGQPALIRLAESYSGWTLVCWNHKGLCHNAILAALADGRLDLIPKILEAARRVDAPREHMTLGTPAPRNGGPAT